MSVDSVPRPLAPQSTPSSEPTPRPTLIGPYHIGKKLGQGAFAAVRLATHLPTNQPVAVKLIDKRKIQSEYEQKLLQREVSLLHRCRHPHIIELLEVIDIKDFLCIVTDLQSEDLLSYLADNGALSENRARALTRQLLSAVHYLHSLNIVHRDLKVENLMLDAAGNLKVIDFGLSNELAEGKTHFDTWCGSLAYSAPELLGQKPYGKEVDIWGIGICLYVMLTVKLPFPFDNLTQLHAAILDQNYTLPDHLSPALKELLDRVFEFKPKKRITLQGIAEHVWITQGATPSPSLLEIPPDPIKSAELDDAILGQLVRMGIGASETQIRQAVLAEPRNKAYAAYRLLLLSKQRHAAESIATALLLETRPPSGSPKFMCNRHQSMEGKQRPRSLVGPPSELLSITPRATPKSPIPPIPRSPSSQRTRLKVPPASDNSDELSLNELSLASAPKSGSLQASQAFFPSDTASSASVRGRETRRVPSNSSTITAGAVTATSTTTAATTSGADSTGDSPTRIAPSSPRLLAAAGRRKSSNGSVSEEFSSKLRRTSNTRTLTIGSLADASTSSEDEVPQPTSPGPAPESMPAFTNNGAGRLMRRQPQEPPGAKLPLRSSKAQLTEEHRTGSYETMLDATYKVTKPAVRPASGRKGAAGSGSASPNHNTPAGLEFLSTGPSYAAVITQLIAQLVGGAGGLDSQSVSQMLHRALRAAPDQQLVGVLQSLGWDGVSLGEDVDFAALYDGLCSLGVTAPPSPQRSISLGTRAASAKRSTSLHNNSEANTMRRAVSVASRINALPPTLKRQTPRAVAEVPVGSATGSRSSSRVRGDRDRSLSPTPAALAGPRTGSRRSKEQPPAPSRTCAEV